MYYEEVAGNLNFLSVNGELSLENDWFDLNQIDTLVETWATKEALLPLVGAL